MNTKLNKNNQRNKKIQYSNLQYTKITVHTHVNNLIVVQFAKNRALELVGLQCRPVQLRQFILCVYPAFDVQRYSNHIVATVTQKLTRLQTVYLPTRHWAGLAMPGPCHQNFRHVGWGSTGLNWEFIKIIIIFMIIDYLMGEVPEPCWSVVVAGEVANLTELVPEDAEKPKNPKNWCLSDQLYMENYRFFDYTQILQ